MSSNGIPEKPSLEEALACQFSSWYPKFSGSKTPSQASTWNDSRKCVTIKSHIIQNIPIDFISYLLSDGMTLPEGATNVSSFIPPDTEDDESWSSSSDTDKEDDPSKYDQDTVTKYNLMDLTEQISQAISSLGGSVIPKLNWSAPRDASWINNGTLRCETPGDVYLLIKSSDFCMHDLMYTLDSTRIIGPVLNHELILRKWCNFWPSMEFRCFVSEAKIGTFSFSVSCHYNTYGHSTNKFMVLYIHSWHLPKKSYRVLRIFTK
jgi:hypothetical protein